MDHNVVVTEERQRRHQRHLPHWLLRHPEGSTLLGSPTDLLADDGRMSSQSALALRTSRSLAPLVVVAPCAS